MYLKGLGLMILLAIIGILILIAVYLKLKKMNKSSEIQVSDLRPAEKKVIVQLAKGDLARKPAALKVFEKYKQTSLMKTSIELQYMREITAIKPNVARRIELKKQLTEIIEAPL